MELNTVAIGGNLNALLYSFSHQIPLLYTRVVEPSRIDDPVLLHKTFPCSVLWNNIYYLLAVKGNILFGNKIEHVRLEENKLCIFTKRARNYTIVFKKVIIFDDHRVSGIPTELEEANNSLYEVRDWFKVRSGMRHDFETLQGNENFVNKIIFYRSPRIDGEHDFKDAVALSYLSSEDISSDDYSDINARFKTLSMMKEAGIKGARNGRDGQRPTHYKYYSIKLETEKREIVRPMNHYKSTPRYIFNYDSIDDIIKSIDMDSDASRLFRKYTSH